MSDERCAEALRDHLEAALDAAETADGRYHVRQALQLLDAERRVENGE